MSKADKIFKIVYIIACLLWNTLIIGVIAFAWARDAMQPSLPDGGAESNIGFTFIFLIVGVICGGIGNTILVAIALIGSVIAACRKTEPNRFQRIRQYIGLVLLPILTELLLIICCLYTPQPL